MPDHSDHADGDHKDSATPGPAATSRTIATSAVPSSVDAARRVLAAALDADQSGTDAPPDADPRLDADRFTIAEALAVLDDVTPPYPPLPQRLDPVPSGVARQQALAHLEAALDEVTTVQDLTRIGLAALVLRRGGGVAA